MMSPPDLNVTVELRALAARVLALADQIESDPAAAQEPLAREAFRLRRLTQEVAGQLMALIGHEDEARSRNQRAPSRGQSGVTAWVERPGMELQGMWNWKFMVLGELHQLVRSGGPRQIEAFRVQGGAQHGSEQQDAAVAGERGGELHAPRRPGVDGAGDAPRPLNRQRVGQRLYSARTTGRSSQRVV